MGKTKSFLQRTLNAEPHVVLLLGIAWGVLLIVGGYSLQIGSFITPQVAPFNAAGVRQVGYGSALNWSFTYAILFPISLCLMAESLRCVKDTLGQLHAKGMVRDESMARIVQSSWTESWIKGSAGRGLLIAGIGIALPVMASLIEWYQNNYLRLMGRGPAADYPDYDWGLAALMLADTHTARLWNAGFDLLCFMTYGLLLSSSIIYFILLLDLARVLPTHREAGSGQLIPYLVPGDKKDKRRGFEVFDEPLQQMLAVALLSYLICYLVRLEGAYMNSTGVPDLWTFVKPTFLLGIEQAKAGSTSGVASSSIAAILFDTGNTTIRGYLSVIATFILFALSMQVVVVTVRIAAKLARENALTYFDGPDATPLFGQLVAEERDLARDMAVWPLKYLKPNLLLLTLALSAASIYWYRIGLYIAGLVIATLLVKLVAKVKKLEE